MEEIPEELLLLIQEIVSGLEGEARMDLLVASEINKIKDRLNKIEDIVRGLEAEHTSY